MVLNYIYFENVVKFMEFSSIVTGLLAAVLWFFPACGTVMPMAHLNVPPTEVENRVKKQAWLNAVAAGLTGFSMFFQAAKLLLTK